MFHRKTKKINRHATHYQNVGLLFLQISSDDMVLLAVAQKPRTVRAKTQGHKYDVDVQQTNGVTNKFKELSVKGLRGLGMQQQKYKTKQLTCCALIWL